MMHAISKLQHPTAAYTSPFCYYSPDPAPTRSQLLFHTAGASESLLQHKISKLPTPTTTTPTTTTKKKKLTEKSHKTHTHTLPISLRE
jgi:hypothetical protein